MIQALMLSFQSLSDTRVARLLVKVIALTLGIFVVLGIGLWFAMASIFGWLNLTDGETWSALLSIALSFLVAILLFRVVAIAVTWVFADNIIDAVEDHYYPQFADIGKRPGLATGVQMAVRSVIRVIAYNVLALPLYVILFFTGVGTAFVFMLVNALLLGRDLEDMLIARHGPTHGSIRKLPRLLLGLLGTIGMLVPVLNLFVPVLITAMAVHMVHSGVAKL